MWKWLKSLFTRTPKIVTVVAPKPQVETANQRIMRVASAELGVKETQGGETKRIIEYHAATTGKFDEDEIPWCASFMCWVMDHADVPSTKSALAASYKTWGDRVDGISNAMPGDVIVRVRSGGNHVHLLFEAVVPGSSLYKALGGNQSNAVTIAAYPTTGIIAIRRAKS